MSNEYLTRPHTVATDRPATLIDISVTVSPTTAEWPGDTPFSCGWTWDMALGSSVNVSSITMSPHVGTHADAPIHVKPGAPGADALPLDAFYGPVLVVDVSDAEGEIEMDLLIERIGEAAGFREMEFLERILLKTGHTIAKGSFPDSWPAISQECAAELVTRGLKLLGVDCPSVDDRNSKTLDIHHELFGHGAYVLENLDLQTVKPGRYDIAAFPLKFAGLDAAPLRAVLFREEVSPKQ